MGAYYAGGLNSPGLRCPKCGQPVVEGDAFCQTCGNRLDSPAIMNQASPEGLICPRCNAFLEPGYDFCFNCGYKLETGGAKAADPARVCPRCSSPVEEGDAVCWSCGYRLVGTLRVDSDDDLAIASLDNPVIDDGYPERIPQFDEPPLASQEPEVDAVVQRDSYQGIIAPKDVSPNVANMLVVITRDEARLGCVKEIEVDEAGFGSTIKVRIPAGIKLGTKVDVPGLGYFDENTGQRGPLRLSFYIAD